MNEEHLYACECGCKQIICKKCKCIVQNVNQPHICRDNIEKVQFEKVRLPKDVCEALDRARNILRLSKTQIVKDIVLEQMDFEAGIKILNNQNAWEIMRALVLGYEPEQSAEEQLKAIWESSKKGMLIVNAPFRNGIETALKIHGIHYDWMGVEK